MDNSKNDSYFIAKIQEDLSFIVKHMKDADIEDLSSNELLQDSMLFRLIQVSENAKKLTDEFKDGHGSIPWIAIYGLRNRIVLLALLTEDLYVICRPDQIESKVWSGWHFCFSDPTEKGVVIVCRMFLKSRLMRGSWRSSLSA